MYEGLDQKTILAAEKALAREAAKEEIKALMLEYAQKIDPEIEIEESKQFESDTFNKVVYAAFDEFYYTYDDEILHKIVMKEMGYELDISIQTYSFLHEIGHIVTMQKYESAFDVSVEYDRQRFAIVNSGMDPLSSLRRYKKLQLEKDADGWAYSHYQENKKIIEDLDKKFWEIADRG